MDIYVFYCKSNVDQDDSIITKERLSDLNDLIRSDSITNRTLYFFRNLNDIIKSKNSASVKTNDTNRLWANSSWYDLLSSYRLDLLYVLYWALTSDPKLYKLYVYVRDRTVSTTDPNENALALFPGSLVDSGSGESPLEQIYDDLKEHIESVDGFLGRLFRPGALDYLLCYYRGRAI